ncbi:Phosphomannomutase (plasmid) [Borrelia nietonii YOR]|uniref:Phosphomannomutase n=2 Tax=Borrelia TaxID=138 RepID=W5SH07_9SPIR|nr:MULTISPECIES: hypothetical protein [Borrelia]AHH04371.1 Phosphomannomutase [Borrelia nietonii YOR]AHH14804.1 Phosphomannomutase [Borrelia hermsii MTW]UPA10071.1 hypothetical protein bhYOR_001438 [Borrelia nietonii YOR]
MDVVVNDETSLNIAKIAAPLNTKVHGIEVGKANLTEMANFLRNEALIAKNFREKNQMKAILHIPQK